ncbi:gliding motility-associated-like protein [Flavobacterium sp. 270]|uniref:HYR domain-containing protein n=1 Tax=Flavobacterium sp. 270 TaxID=2512114 RepID=UPI001064DC4B|nr:HYR domain-containing protein [Flavobacterium sp. 270]TDW52832.1 gliding motility-associated-like protein [Flavobacterium sp. 270]
MVNNIRKLNHFQIILVLFLFLRAVVSYGQNGCPQVSKSILDGANGFSVSGKTAQDDLGYMTKSAGDINGDGIPDLMIGAPGADFGGTSNVGEIYVIFGGSGFSFDTFDVSTLNGTNGFVIRGVAAEEKLGSMLSTAGDFNNDGIDDIIIGDNFDPSSKATAIVFYGKNTGFQALYNRTDIDNSKGVFITLDVATVTSVKDVSFAGDVNHDGIDDIVITDNISYLANYYVVFGSGSIANLNTSSLTGLNGFTVKGYTQPLSGLDATARNAGDINNDGIDDLIFGCPSYDESTDSNTGRVIVLFGKNLVFPSLLQIQTLSPSDGFIITNTGQYNIFGKSVSGAGDFNHDGIDDILIGAPGKQLNGNYSVGEAYVVFGRNLFPSTFAIESLTASTGVVFQGSKISGQFGFNVNDLGDVNNDGKDDIAISSKRGISNNGAVYVVFGGNTATGIINEKLILKTVGYQVFDSYDSYTNNIFGCDVDGIGDFNQDGKNDFVLGYIRNADHDYDKGNAYIFYGETFDRIDAVKPTIDCPVNQQLFVNSSLPDYVSFLPNLIDNCTYINNFDLTIVQNPPQGTLFTADTNVSITVTDLSGNVSTCSFLVKVKAPVASPTCKTSSYSVENLDGSNGFVIYGENGNVNTGFAVNKAGDVNGDGLTDFIVSASGASYPFSGAFGNTNDMIKGSVYVVFGKASGFPPIVDLKYLNGTNGFKIRDNIDLIADDRTGYKTAGTGDLNGDGIDDFMFSSPTRKGATWAVGAVYIIFGKTSGFPAEFLLTDLNGANGFTFMGSNYYETLGESIDTIGDFNNDGHPDIAIAGAGTFKKVYIIYGKNGSFPALMLGTDINGTNGCVITSNSATDKVARSAAGLGDINGDGIPDIAIGNYEGVKNYVIYGRSGFPGTFDVANLNGSNGFVVQHSSESLQYGRISKIGDINHDGFNDIAFNRNFILFGSSGLPASVDLANLNGTNGFKISNGFSGDKFGSIGDFNNDGIDDYVFLDGGNSVCVLYGKTTWTSPFDLNTFTVKDGFKITFSYAYNNAVNFAGDINNDGFDDVIIGANKYYSPFESIKVNEDPGKAYIIYGKAVIPDTEKPVITNCPTNKILAIGDIIPDYKTAITVKDNCDNNPIRTQTPLPGTVYTGGTQTITLTATDASTNYQTCSFTISTAGDVVAPVITCPGDQLLACGSLIPDYFSLLTVTDDTDTNIDVKQFPGAGSTFFDGMKIDFTAKDDAGNESHCSITVHASGADTEAPTFTCPTNVTLNCGDLIPNYAIDPMMNLADNCNENVHYEITPVPGTPFYDGIQINIKYTDESGNYANCNFTVHNATPDLTAPVITCAGDQTLACGALLPDYRNLISATDNCAGAVTITQNPVGGSAFVPGMTVTFTATDVSTNYSNCSFIVNAAVDNIKPVIACIGDQTLACGNAIPDYRTLVTVTDNCDASPVLTQNPIVGTAFVDGMTVTITATDATANYATCSFKVNASADVTKPVISCIGDQTLSCGAVIPDYRTLVSVTDNCDASPIITQNPIAGTAFTDGMTVTITATDASTNYAVCNFKINASTDVTKPIITCIGDQTLSCGAVIPDYRTLISVTDNCDASPILTQNPIAGTTFTNGMTVTITATDASTNYTDCSFKINASADVVKPVITCIGDQSLSCGNTIPDYRTLVSVTDNCDASPIVTQNPIAGSAFTDGMTVTITATDASANYETCSFKVNASADVTKPVITCIGDQTLSCGSTIPDYTTLISVTDNCDATPTLTQNPIPGTALTDGMTITITAKDVSNNSSICSFKVNTSADVTAPVLTCIGNQILSCGSIIPDYTPLVTAVDNCDANPVITQSPTAGSVFVDGMTVTITAKDNSNNSTPCSFIINASADVTAPSITCITDQNLAIGAVLPDYRTLITVTDNCDSNLTVTQNPVAGSSIIDGMSVTMNTADNSGNSASCSFVIHVTADTQAPAFTCITDQLLSCNTKVIPDYTKMIFATDNTDPNPKIIQNPVAGSTYQEGMTIKITVSDKYNNSTFCNFQLNTNPVMVDAGDDEQITEGQTVQLEAISLEKGSYKWMPILGLNNSKISNPIASPLETTTYTVIFKNEDGCETEDSVTINVLPLDKDETKYGFSPNNDGINDVWEIDDITQYPNNEVLIYSRWGDLVYQTQGYNNTTNVFNGTANRSRNLGANQLPEGTYFFEIRVNQPHHFKKLKGYLVLKR